MTALRLAWAFRWLILAGLLLAALGVQTYRLQGMTAAHDLLALEKTERIRRDAMREATNERNKERTDDETIAARKRAAAVVVRLDGPGIKPGKSFYAPASGDGPAACIDRGRLGEELDGWADRTSGRLAEVLQRDAGRSQALARAGEGVAADYRACRAWALNLVQAPGLKLAMSLQNAPITPQ